MTEAATTVDHRLAQNWAVNEMRQDVHRAFVDRPIILPPRWLYDEHGSNLFDAITRLGEYYPTEAERSILAANADEIAAITGVNTVVELGSGTSDKTRTLLDAFHQTGQLERFVALDVSEATLLAAADMLTSRYKGLAVHAVVADFTRHLAAIPTDHQRLVAFLGGTIGNFYVEERRAFLGAMADHLMPGEWLLLGMDRVKPLERILAAYNDRAGLTAEFIKNSLTVLNRELDANFDLDAFDYVPFWDALEERVDMRLRASVPQQVRIEALDLDVSLGEADELRVEISAKFHPDRLAAELADVGFELTKTFSDPNQDFCLLLAKRDL